MRILVVRHGRTDWNDEEKIQGTADIELNEVGKNQAEVTRKKLENEKIDLIISSPLIRATQTAKIINKERGIEIILEDRIREREYGKYEGCKKEDFNFNDFWTYSKNLEYEGSENIKDFFARVFNFFDDIKEKYKEKTILLVIHGGVSLAIRAYFEGLPEENKPTRGALKNCEVKEYIL